MQNPSEDIKSTRENAITFALIKKALSIFNIMHFSLNQSNKYGFTLLVKEYL